ncbi:MAG: hypothetical protein ACHREM_01460 [Polyangiales bacterium]
MPFKKFRIEPRHSLRVSRLDAARIIGCSREAVRLMHERGEIRSGQRDSNGWFHYLRTEIELVAARRRRDNFKVDDEKAAQTFELFRAGLPHHEVVTKLRMHPVSVRALRDEFDRGYKNETPREEVDREKREAIAMRERLMREERINRRKDRKLDEEIETMLRAPEQRPSIAKVDTTYNDAMDRSARSIERANEILRAAGEDKKR